MAWLAGYTTVRDKGIHLLIHFQKKKEEEKRGGVGVETQGRSYKNHFSCGEMPEKQTHTHTHKHAARIRQQGEEEECMDRQ